MTANAANKAITLAMLKNDSSSTSNPKSPFGGNSPPSTISPSSINEPSYLETLINNSNPVETLFLGIHLLQFISIILILNLIISLFLKYLSTKNFEFKWVDYIFPGTSKYNKIFKIKLGKILKYWDKSQTVTLVIIISLLLFCNIFSYFYMGILIENFEDFSELYLNFVKNK